MSEFTFFGIFDLCLFSILKSNAISLKYRAKRLEEVLDKKLKDEEAAAE